MLFSKRSPARRYNWRDEPSRLVDIYTDGSCRGQPYGPGAWSVYAIFEDHHRVELAGQRICTCSNQIELEAAIEAVKLVAKSQCHCAVTIHTDSLYVLSGVRALNRKWLLNNFITCQGRTVALVSKWRELLNALYSLPANRKIRWTHVRAHRGNPGNERANALAQKASFQRLKQLEEEFPFFFSHNKTRSPSTGCKKHAVHISRRRQSRLHAS